MANAPAIKLANTAVVLAVVLGSRIAEMRAAHVLIIHGLRASGLAKVGCGNTEFHDLLCVCV